MTSKRWFRIEFLIITLALMARLIPGPRTVDDAYITFRYSQNLLQGYGLVYNPGEAVLGTTTPLYATLLTLAAFIYPGNPAPYPEIALLLNALADSLTCLLLLKLGRRLGYPSAAVALSLLWAISPMSVTFAIAGMETSVTVLLLVGSFYMYSTYRPVVAALLAACSLLARPDTLIAILPLIFARLVTSWRDSSKRILPMEILVFSVPLIIWTGVGIATYGSPIPQSVSAKTVAYRLPTDAAFIRLLQHYATPFHGHLAFGRFYIGFGLLFFPALAILGWRRILQKEAFLWPLAVFPLLYFLTFSIANPLIFRWYLAPPLPLYFAGILVGVETLSREIKKPILFLILSLSFVVLSLNAWTLHPDHGPDRPAPEMAYIKLEELYIEAVTDIKPRLKDGVVIAAGDIGAIGYHSGARILDLVGLITPDTSKYFPLTEDQYVINYAIPTQAVLDYAPDYLIMLEVYGRRTLLLDPDFQARYALYSTYPTDIYGSHALLIFERKD